MMEKYTEAALKRRRELTKERPQLDAECTEDEVEQEVAWLLLAFSSVRGATAKKVTIWARSRWWWNANIIARRSTVRSGRRRRHISEEATQWNGDLPKLIRQFKSTMWSNYLQNCRRAEMCIVAKYMMPQAGLTV